MKISENLYCFEDTCNVYAILNGDQAVLVDFGDGSVLDRLEALGVKRVTDVLMTHHHRDQGQGLARAAQGGARIWVPNAEQELFREVDAYWQARQVMNNYNVRQDRFSLLEPVPVAGTLRDYAISSFGGRSFNVLPTPGHTPGSLSLLVEVDGQSLAFTGDLIAAPGKVWSLAATQWTYNGAEGAAASLASLFDLKEKKPGLLLPSHGQPMEEPEAAIDLLISRLACLLEYRGENPRLFDWQEHPYVSITPHLLLNRTSLANSYILLSDTGKALVIDFGYDFMTGEAAGTERAARRPWLHSLPMLKRDFGVQKIEAAVPTHYHDDHVAGLNLLRDVEGAEVWAAETFADILEDPASYDLPCLWHAPILVDRRLPLESSIRWEEYELALYPLPGHTRYAVAIGFTVDGKRVLATGDQDMYERGPRWNYVYQNRFDASAYRRSAALYARLKPDLILPGHWEPQAVQPELVELLDARGQALECLHRDLLPDEVAGLTPESFEVHIQPYQITAHGGERFDLEVILRNPFPCVEEAAVRLAAPDGWKVDEGEVRLQLEPGAEASARFHILPPAGKSLRRARLAADLTVGKKRFGQQAEALVTVLYPDFGPVSLLARPGSKPAISEPAFLKPVYDNDFPDPGVLATGKVYYAFATNSRGVHIQAALSADLVHWEPLPDALPELPAWAVQKFGFTWSPSVSAAAGSSNGFQMYFTTRFDRSPQCLQSIGVAAADRPGGPFRCTSSGPLVFQMDQGGSIDPDVFTDEDGSRYLLWKNDGNSVHKRTWIYIQRLSEDGLRLESQPTRLITADQPWEGYVVEGPSLWKHEDKYYLFYSANDFTTSRYAIGWAVADSPYGPYRKAPEPFLVSNMAAGLTGPGGQSMILGLDGETYMLFHARQLGWYRALFTARLAWDHEVPIVADLCASPSTMMDGKGQPQTRIKY